MKVEHFAIALYDLSIEDIKERRKKRIEYESSKKASAKLGISENILKRACSNKDRLFIKELNGEYAIRHINLEKNARDTKH